MWMISCMLLSCYRVVFPDGLSRTEVAVVFVLLVACAHQNYDFLSCSTLYNVNDVLAKASNDLHRYS